MSSENATMKKGNTYMQWMLALLANGSVLSYGFEIGWISPVTTLLQSDNSPTGHSLSDTDIAWIASAMNLSASVGVVVYRYITDVYGRKAALLSLALPQLLSWVFKVVYPTTVTLVISRVFGGIAGSGVFMAVPIYVKEISDDSIRGALATILPVVQYTGVIVMYVFGTYLDYYHVVYSVIGVPVLVTLLLIKALETPNFLVKQGRINEALECVAYLKGLDKSDSRVKSEVESMEKMDAINKKIPEISTFQLMISKSWRKWILIITIVFTLRGWNGSLCIQSYAVVVLLSIGVTFQISPEVLTFGIPLVMIVAALLLTAFVERFERKSLLCWAHTTSAISMLALAVAMLLQHHGTDIPGWLPVAAIMVGSAVFTGGVSPLPYILATEMFHFEIRAKVMAIVSVYSWFSIFVITFLHPILVKEIGSSNTFFMYVALNIFGALFAILFLPKTRGKTEEEIQKVMGTH